ncbi:MAG: TetR-like C-terminal domain-containing protein [Eubacteriales bacterium]
MARKETITREYVLTTTFDMVRQKGYGEVTARKLADQLGCSTQPIFRLYNGMSSLLEAVYPLAIEFFHNHTRTFMDQNKVPFVDLGMAYIVFAREETNLFRLLFLSDVRQGRSMYELLNAEDGFVSGEIVKATNAGSQQPSELFMKLWICIHGIACMTLTNDYDLTTEETLVLLKDSYYAYF